MMDINERKKEESAVFDEKKREKSSFKLPLVRFTVYVLLLAVLLTGATFSRYSSNFETGDSARVASFSVSFVQHDTWSIDEFNDVTAHELNGSKTYTFTVTNTGEVAIRVRLVVDVNDLAVTVNPTGWFNLAVGAAQTVTLNTKGKIDGHDVKFYFEYEQIA